MPNEHGFQSPIGTTIVFTDGSEHIFERLEINQLYTVIDKQK